MTKRNTQVASVASGYEAYLVGDTRKLAAAIKSIKARSSTLDRDIHNAGVGCIGRSNMDGGDREHGLTLALRLVQALSPGQSRKRVVAWLHHFSNIRITAKTVNGDMTFTAKLLRPDHKDYKAVNLIAANDTPFWKLNEEADVTVQTFDTAFLAKRLGALAKAYNEAKAAGHVELSLVEQSLMDSLLESARIQKERAIAATPDAQRGLAA